MRDQPDRVDELLTAELRARHGKLPACASHIHVDPVGPNFRRFDSSGMDDEPHRRLAGSSLWLERVEGQQSRRGSHDVEQRVQIIAVRQRHAHGWLHRRFPDCYQQCRPRRFDCFSA